MTKAYLTPPRSIKLPNGSRMNFGQVIGDAKMTGPYQRSLNSSSPFHPRNGAPKRAAVEAPPVVGQKRQTPDSVFTGPGQSALDDEPNLPIKSHAKPIPVHSGMTNKQRAALDPVANNGDAILQDAVRMARPADKA
jgi:hypothetical protein